MAMTDIKWTEMVDDVVNAALEVYPHDKGGKAIFDELFDAGEGGTSFSQLRGETKLNPSSLQRRLGSYIKAGLVENFLRKTEDARFYSQYRLTIVGKVVIKEIGNMENSLRRKVVAELENISEVPEVRRLANRVKPQLGLDVSVYTRYSNAKLWEPEHYIARGARPVLSLMSKQAEKWSDIEEGSKREEILFPHRRAVTVGDN